MEIEERVVALETNQKNIFHQLDEQKSEIKNISRLTIAVEKIANRTENIEGKVDNIDARLDLVEQEPVKKYTKIRDTVITAVITGILGALIGALLAVIIK